MEQQPPPEAAVPTEPALAASGLTDAAPTASPDATDSSLEARLYGEAIQLQPNALVRLVGQLSAYVQAHKLGPPTAPTGATTAPAAAPAAASIDDNAAAPGHAAASIWPTIATTQPQVSGSTLPEPTRKMNAGQAEDMIYIPNKHVGIVIGKGGEMIRTLQDRSQARIQVQPDRERDMTSDVRRITVTGFPAYCDEAKRLVWRAGNTKHRQDCCFHCSFRRPALDAYASH